MGSARSSSVVERRGGFLLRWLRFVCVELGIAIERDSLTFSFPCYFALTHVLAIICDIDNNRWQRCRAEKAACEPLASWKQAPTGKVGC